MPEAEIQSESPDEGWHRLAQQEQQQPKDGTKEGPHPLMRLHQRSLSVTSSSLRMASAGWRGRRDAHAPPPADTAPTTTAQAEWNPFPALDDPQQGQGGVSWGAVQEEGAGPGTEEVEHRRFGWRAGAARDGAPLDLATLVVVRGGERGRG